MDSCTRRSVCFCSQSDGDASIRTLTQYLQSCDRGRRAVRSVRLPLEVVTHYDRDFVD